MNTYVQLCKRTYSRYQGKSTNNAAFAAAKVISDADVASGGPNSSPVGRPTTQEAAAPHSPRQRPRGKAPYKAPISHLTEPVMPKIAVCPNFGSRASLML